MGVAATYGTYVPESGTHAIRGTAGPPVAEGTVSVDPSAAVTSVVTVVTVVTAKGRAETVVTVGESVYGTLYMLQQCRV